MGFIKDDKLHIECGIDEYENLKEYEERRLYLFGAIVSIDSYSILIDATPAQDITERILAYNREDKGLPIENRKPIYLYINSPGGDVNDGFALATTIELSKTPVYTINIGQWSSMSFLIGIAGAVRFSLPNMTFLLHDGSLITGGSANKVQDQVRFNARYEETVVKPYVLRHSNMTSEDYDGLVRFEFYMLPEDAKKYGFIDKIVTDLDEIL